MSRGPNTLARLRPVAGPTLLVVFVLALQLAPAAHLTTHRHGHSHGPEPPLPFAGPDDTDHDDHGDFEDEGFGGSGGFDDHHHGDDTGVSEAHDDAADHHHGAVPAAPHRPASEHGQSSAAHFGLALLQGPPAPFLPPPAETNTAPLDAVPKGRCAAPHPQPPARGPPSRR